MTAVAQRPALTLADYFSQAQESDRFSGSTQHFDKLRFGFFGEVGGLLAAVKKVSRDHLLESETEVAGEEIGDSLWYLIAAANAVAVTPDQLGEACLRALRTRFGERDRQISSPINLRQMDGIVATHSYGLDTRRTELLAELAHVSGELVVCASKSKRRAATSVHIKLLGELLAYLTLVSASFNLLIEEVARDNLAKVRGRWPGPNRKYVGLFDDEFPEHEQIPRRLEIEFIERGGRVSGHVVQRLRGVYIGDRLTDNSNEPDDYRFHDVFHLAYVAHLGWSPVIRALLKAKRKSKPAIDENEDGARAMIIEEGIATWIFNHAKKRAFYKDIETGKLDYGLLKQVHSMVSGYQVDKCPLWQWETAVLEGFRVFRDLREHRGGTVTVDMIKRMLSFKPHKKP